MKAEGVHERRVELRKYLVVARQLLGKDECVKNARKEVKSLGGLRDAKVAGCVPLPHLELKRLEMSGCFLRKIPGSRLMIAERIFSLYCKSNGDQELHPLRKKVREVLFLLESLGIRDDRLKGIAKELGKLRDDQLRSELCSGERRDFDVREYRDKFLEVTRELLMTTEFNHIKNKLR